MTKQTYTIQVGDTVEIGVMSARENPIDTVVRVDSTEALTSKGYRVKKTSMPFDQGEAIMFKRIGYSVVSVLVSKKSDKPK